MGKNNTAHIILTLLQQIQKKSSQDVCSSAVEVFCKHQVLLLKLLRLLSLAWNGGHSSQFLNGRQPSCPFVEGGFDRGEGWLSLWLGAGVLRMERNPGLCLLLSLKFQILGKIIYII